MKRARNQSHRKLSVRNVSERQQQLLRLLQQEKPGLTVDQIAAGLAITRNAVRQHLAALERDGYVRKAELRKTAGRPSIAYVLTRAGDELFPKQYSWFSSAVLGALRRERGSEALALFLRKIASSIAAGLESRVAGKAPEERVAALVQIMNELGYDARTVQAKGAPATVVATNCVYHDLAREYREVCEFDYELMEKLTGRSVDHPECMVRGGNVCRFHLGPVG